MKNLVTFTIFIIAIQIYAIFAGNQFLKATAIVVYIFIIWNACYLILGEFKASVFATIGMLFCMVIIFVLVCLMNPDSSNAPPKVFLNKELIAKGSYHVSQSD